MAQKKLNVFLVLSWLICAEKPTYIMMIRHGEKQLAQPKDLSPTGWQRAELISKLLTGEIKGHSCLNEFLNKHPITEVFAHKPTNLKPTIRTIETLMPYSKATNKAINTEHSKTKLTDVVQEIANNKNNLGKLFLFSVSHGRPMNKLLKELNLQDIAGQWYKSRYDHVWIFIFKHGKATLVSLPQNLMPGDTKHTMLHKEKDLDLVCPSYASSL
jgi:hypothetical protein